MYLKNKFDYVIVLPQKGQNTLKSALAIFDRYLYNDIVCLQQGICNKEFATRNLQQGMMAL